MHTCPNPLHTSNVHWGQTTERAEMSSCGLGQMRCARLSARPVFSLQGSYMTHTHCLRRPGTLTSSTS